MQRALRPSVPIDQDLAADAFMTCMFRARYNWVTMLTPNMTESLFCPSTLATCWRSSRVILSRPQLRAQSGFLGFFWRRGRAISFNELPLATVVSRVRVCWAVLKGAKGVEKPRGGKRGERLLVAAHARPCIPRGPLLALV